MAFDAKKFHKEYTTEISKAENHIEDIVSKSESALVDAFYTHFKSKRNDKGRIDFTGETKEQAEEKAKKGAEELYWNGAKALVQSFIAPGASPESIDDLLRNDRFKTHIEHTLEQRYGISKKLIVESVKKDKYITGFSLMAYQQMFTQGMVNARKQEIATKAQEQLQSVDDFKAFNKYMKRLARDNKKDPDVQQTLTALQKKGVDIGKLLDPTKSALVDPETDLKVWVNIAPQIPLDYDFAKRMREIEERRRAA